eukprot:TRINITY_DN7954_c0_g1_i1.p1 TRINITY_DN7954_c0_g1~~TRINITY_DN7954_c0_g1_i1.p1  ORF type:complete len:673 (+),score=83.71 TRINITY_DN7954_c0_g1_i1:108-2126(+)
MRMLLLLAVVLMIPSCQGQTSEDVKFMESQPIGCFRQGFSYSSYIPNTSINTTSIQRCQAKCQKVSGCVKFAYYAWRGECWFADAKATMKPTGGAYVIAGHRTCSQQDLAIPERCISEKPLNGFPGISAANSNAAWKGGQQPAPSECWPTWWDGQALACNQIGVLDGTAKGWPGKCRGLVEIEGVNGTDCEANCRSNPSCQSYQNSVYYSCWQGLGFDCFVRQNFVPRDAKRFQHGRIRVLMDLKGWQIVGLYKAFDNSQGFFDTDQTAIEYCKHVCYSDIRCEYWSYAPKFGCWVHDAAQEYVPAYPLTLSSAMRDTPFALDSIAGEYIQHLCDPTMVSKDVPKPFTNLTKCAEKGVRYDPPNMALQSRTIVPNYEACRQRCKATLNCAYFAWWPNGGCHIADATAHRVTAEDWGVVSGPVDCSRAYTTTSPGPGDWIHSTVAPANEAPKLLDESQVRMAEIAYSIHNLDLSKTTVQEKNLLKSKHAEAIANSLDIPVIEVRDRNGRDAMKAMVQLVAGETTGRRLSSAETLIVAYVPNQPPNSEDPSAIASKIRTADFAQLAKDATLEVVHADSAAILQSDGRGIEITEPQVGTKDYPLPAFQEVSEPSTWTRWWPLIAALVLVCCGGAACASLGGGDRSRRYQKGRSDSMQSDDDEFGRNKVWASGSSR